MKRAIRIFLAALVCSAAMLGTARSIRPGIDGPSVMLGMLRFILIVGGATATVAVWATAMVAAAHAFFESGERDDFTTTARRRL